MAIHDPELLSKGTIFLSTEDSGGFDKRKQASGIPRKYWHVSEDEVTFTTFKQRKFWDESKAAPFPYQASKQLKTFRSMIATLRGETANVPGDYAGGVYCFASAPSDHTAKAAAAIVADAWMAMDESAIVVWVDVNQTSKWGRHIAPDWKNAIDAPSLVILTGLHTRPTADLYENARRWYEWAIRFAPCLMVGAGADPVEIFTLNLNIKPNAVYFCTSEYKRSVTVG